ncbi:DUF4198 domain-containing protein [Rhodobacter sp. NSM]|uniref:DUF4198 domain-containing protein n=1 Tax=Rhodobacter sp. NSM TaxID=3457501 RepID=UPI003FD5D922
MKLRHAMLAAGLMMPAAAEAHFQLIYAETPLIEAPGDVPVKLVFWHPFENGHVMDMGRPQAFYAVSRGQRIDLSQSLRPFTFAGVSNAAQAFDAMVPVTKAGDYVLVVEAAPYLEPSEDIYIQQYAKVYLNRMQLPTDWTEPQGLPTEILPLVKPYNVIAGSTFTGRVLSEGEPVAAAVIEVEYMAAEPDAVANAPRTPTARPMPGGAVVAISDDAGYFTFGIPTAGWWGFAALGTGPVKEHAGKELSQDAVIWVRAWDLE